MTTQDMRKFFEEKGIEARVRFGPYMGEYIFELSKGDVSEEYLFETSTGRWADFGLNDEKHGMAFCMSSYANFISNFYDKKGNTNMNKHLMNLAAAKEVYLNCDGTIVPIRIQEIKTQCDRDTELICTLPSVIEDVDRTSMIPNMLGCYSFFPVKGRKPIGIKNVIFNPPATIVFWTDNTKTVVKAGEHDIYDPEKGLALAITKKVFGNKGKYYNEIRKWVEPYLKKCEEEIAKYAEIFSRDQVVSSDEVEKALPWRIWFNDNAGIVGCYYKSYYRRCNAVQVANRLSLKNPDLNYVVSKTNPWEENKND